MEGFIFMPNIIVKILNIYIIFYVLTLLSGIYPLPAIHSLLVTSDVRNMASHHNNPAQANSTVHGSCPENNPTHLDPWTRRNDTAADPQSISTEQDNSPS